MVDAPILPLRLQGVQARRRGVTLVGPVDAVLDGQGITAVMGPNGAGKTSLLRLMHGLERPRGGRRDWAVPFEQARAAQSFVFQSPILMRRSVVECIAYPLRLRGMGRRAARARAEAAAAEAGLAKMAGRSALSLSAGEKQKLALVRALITEPQVLFLDEPCASLDGRATREIEEMLHAARARGMRIVMTTHDAGQARRLADDIWFLQAGRLVETAPAAQFLAAPQSRAARAYLAGEIVE